MKKIEWLEQAQNDVRALDRSVAQRIYASIRRYAGTETGDVKRLKDFGGQYRLRVGDWRVFFTIEGDALRIRRVLHRSQAYR